MIEIDAAQDADRLSAQPAAVYTVTIGRTSNGREDDAAAAAKAAEADEAATVLDGWISWIVDVRDEIAAGGGDAEDIDNVLAVVMGHIADEIEISAKGAEERAGAYARDVLLRADDSNNKIAKLLREAREGRERQAIEAEALAERLGRLDDAIAALTKENGELRTKLTACEETLVRATSMLEREISKERSLRRLLDSRRNRPPAQKIASELAKKHAEKMLQLATSKTEEAA